MPLSAVLGLGYGAGGAMVRLAKRSLLRRIVVLRHANACSDGTLSPLGLEQCTRARGLLGRLAGPRIFCSSAASTRQTAQHLVPGAEAHALRSVWSTQPDASAIRAAFESLGHAPLTAYLNFDSLLLRPQLLSYAGSVWDEALGATDAPQLERCAGTLTLVSHAVLASATARYAGLALGAEPDSVVRDTACGEACGFLLDAPEEGKRAWTMRYVQLGQAGAGDSSTLALCAFRPLSERSSCSFSAMSFSASSLSSLSGEPGGDD